MTPGDGLQGDRVGSGILGTLPLTETSVSALPTGLVVLTYTGPEK